MSYWTIKAVILHLLPMRKSKDLTPPVGRYFYICMTDMYYVSPLDQGPLEILKNKTDNDPWLSEVELVARATRL